MIRAFVLGLGFAIVAGPASAACTTAALAGAWRMVYQGGYCDANVSRSGNIGGGCGHGRVSLTRDCRISGNIQGYTFEGRTEAIGRKSALKPNHVVGYGPSLRGIAGYRR